MSNNNNNKEQTIRFNLLNRSNYDKYLETVGNNVNKVKQDLHDYIKHDDLEIKYTTMKEIKRHFIAKRKFNNAFFEIFNKNIEIKKQYIKLKKDWVAHLKQKEQEYSKKIEQNPNDDESRERLLNIRAKIRHEMLIAHHPDLQKYLETLETHFKNPQKRYTAFVSDMNKLNSYEYDILSDIWSDPWLPLSSSKFLRAYENDKARVKIAQEAIGQNKNRNLGWFGANKYSHWFGRSKPRSATRQYLDKLDADYPNDNGARMLAFNRDLKSRQVTKTFPKILDKTTRGTKYLKKRTEIDECRALKNKNNETDKFMKKKCYKYYSVQNAYVQKRVEEFRKNATFLNIMTLFNLCLKRWITEGSTTLERLACRLMNPK